MADYAPPGEDPEAERRGGSQCSGRPRPTNKAIAHQMIRHVVAGGRQPRPTPFSKMPPWAAGRADTKKKQEARGYICMVGNARQPARQRHAPLHSN
jgi:hypothetical protein